MVDSRVVFVNLTASQPQPEEDARVVFYGLRASQHGQLRLTLDGPVQVDPFALVDVVATISGGESRGGISWVQTSGKAAEVLRADLLLRFYAPADIEPGAVSFRATIDDGITADISVGIWPAVDFVSTPDGDWVPTCDYELVDVPTLIEQPTPPDNGLGRSPWARLMVDGQAAETLSYGDATRRSVAFALVLGS